MPFEAVSQSSPILLHIPHSAWNIPDRNSLTISDEELYNELRLITDMHTDVIGQAVAGKEHSMLINHISRLFMDPERLLENEEMEEVGMGFLYTHGVNRTRIREDDPVEREHVAETLYKPYHAKMSEMVKSTLDQHGRAVIIDIHSYSSKALPYELHSEGARPEVCIGTDDYHTSPGNYSTASEVFRNHGFQVGMNTPFSGTFVPLEHYRKDHRVTSLMVEIRRDTYMDELSLEINDDRLNKLVDALKELTGRIVGNLCPNSNGDVQ